MNSSPMTKDDRQTTDWIGCDCHTWKIWKRCMPDVWRHPLADNFAHTGRTSGECFGSLCSCTSYVPMWRKAVLESDWPKIISGWGWTFERMGPAKRAYLRISNFDVIILCSCRPTEFINGEILLGDGGWGWAERENRNYKVTFYLRGVK